MSRLLVVLLTSVAFCHAADLTEYNQAWLLSGNGRYDDAIEAAKAIIAKDPGFYRAYHLIAYASIEARKQTAAESYFRQLSNSDRSNPWPYYGLGRLQDIQGNANAARQYHAECVRRPNTAFPCYLYLGRVSDERDLRSMPAQDGSDDGIIRPADIAKLHFDADLVVLSACHTALGKLVKGEGVDGLSTAFFRAGAARVVVSDWSVNDLAAADFMNEFYAGLSRNLLPSDALRQAKLWMLNLGAPAYRHPYFWAPFIVIGNF